MPICKKKWFPDRFSSAISYRIIIETWYVCTVQKAVCRVSKLHVRQCKLYFDNTDSGCMDTIKNTVGFGQPLELNRCIFEASGLEFNLVSLKMRLSEVYPENNSKSLQVSKTLTQFFY